MTLQKVRIFISSPGDVNDERDKARHVIESLQRHYSGVELRPVLWQDLALPATASFQETIDLILQKEPIDIAVFILWSRLGTPLGPAIARPDGTPYRSGTEREFDLMLTAFEQGGRHRPVILAYTRKDEGSFHQALEGCSVARIEELIAQRKLADSFISEQFKDAEGHNVRAYHSYREPISFAQRLHTHMSQVLDELLETDSAPRWLDEPYRGLAVFDVEHAPIFQGRDEETCDLLQRLRDQEQAGCAFAVIVGASGSGKSSLARAGVAATLAQHSYDDQVAAWRVVTFFPGLGGSELNRSLTRVLAEQLPELRSSATALDDIADGLTKDATLTVKLSIEPAFVRAAEAAKGLVRILLLVDQIEELWTDRRITDVDRERFLNVLEALARSGHVAVLATLRSDFYPHAQRIPIFLKLKGDRGHYDLLPPGAASLYRLITEPARLAGLQFERENQTGRTLDQLILQDACRDPAALPLLQYALSELYQQRDPATRMLTFAAYQTLGGVEGALGKRAAETFQSLPPEVRAALPEILPLLVTIDIAEEQSAVRRRAPLAELTTTPARRALTESFIAARFLTTDRHDDMPIVSLAHEALLRRWQDLASWVADNREHLHLRARTEQNQQRWAQQAEDPSLFLPAGLPLEEGQTLLRDARPLLTTETLDYIERSVIHRQSESRRQRLVRTTAMAMSLSAAAIAIVAAAWINSERTATNVQRVLAERQRAESKRASRNDTAAARRALHDDDEAQRDQRWASGFGSFSKWHEAIALLVRALELDPDNSQAACRLYDALLDGYSKSQLPNHRIVLDDGDYETIFTNGRPRITPSNELSRVILRTGATVQSYDCSSRTFTYIPLIVDSMWEPQLSPDGTRVLVAGASALCICDSTTGTILAKSFELDRRRFRVSEDELMSHNDYRSVRFSADGARFVTTGSRDKVQIWDAATVAPIGQPIRHENAEDATFSPDGTLLLTVGSNVARLWEVATGSLKAEFPDKSKLPKLSYADVRRACFSPNGLQLLTIHWERACVWNVQRHDLVFTLKVENSNIDYACFSPDGARIVTCSPDGTARLWNAMSGQVIGRPLSHESAVTHAAFSPDGIRLLTRTHSYGGEPASKLRVWNTHTMLPVGEPLFCAGTGFTTTLPRFNSDGGCVVETNRVWELPANVRRRSPLIRLRPSQWCDLSADGSRFVVGEGAAVRIWDVAAAKPVGTALRHDSSEIGHVEFSKDGTSIVTTSIDNTVRLWNSIDGTPKCTPFQHDDKVRMTHISGDGGRVLTVTNQDIARLWDSTSSRVLAEFPLNGNDGIRLVKLSCNGARIVVTDAGDNPRVLDSQTGKQLCEISGAGTVQDAVFSPQGNTFVTFGNREAHIWDALTGQQIGPTLEHSAEINTLCFSPDGVRIVTGSNDSTAQMWDSTTGRLSGSSMKHEGPVQFVDFSADGSRILTVSDQTARVWDVSGNAVSEMVLQHDEKVQSARFGKDATQVVTVCENPFLEYGSVIWLWEILSAAERRQVRRITPEVLAWAKSVSGLRFRADGECEAIPEDERFDAFEKSRLPEGPWADLASWLSQPRMKHTVSPKSKMTLKELAKWKANDDSRASANSALLCDPNTPLARLQIANDIELNWSERSTRLDEATVLQAAYLRYFEIDRLPDDEFIRLRAADLLNRSERARIGLGSKAQQSAEVASQMARSALERIERVQSLGVGDPETAHLCNDLGVYEFRAHQPQWAVRFYREAERRSEDRGRRSKNWLQLQVNLAAALRNLGAIEEARTKLDAAIAELDMSQPNSFLRGRARYHVALCQLKLNDVVSAERRAFESIQEYEKLGHYGFSAEDELMWQQSIDLLKELLHLQGRSELEIEVTLQKLGVNK